MTAHELLVKTRNNLPGRWNQHRMYDGDNACLVGHLVRSHGDADAFWQEEIKLALDEQAFADAMHILAEILPSPGYLLEVLPDDMNEMDLEAIKVTFFNDHANSEDVVLALLDKAIALTAPEPHVELEEPAEVDLLSVS